jgi:NAD(P)-dependent dehydrogenase (short-subunit alcohol dehydrogenase family)
VETLDICEQAQVTALRERLSGRVFEMLFVNAGTTNNEKETIGEVTTEEFVRVMVTNALCPMRVVESLQDLVSVNGLIGVMSSGQGSVANNVTGMREVYRGSKAALNQLMRSYAARHSRTPRAMVLMAPGWVRTEMGGPDARLSIEESVLNLVNVLLKKQGMLAWNTSIILARLFRGNAYSALPAGNRGQKGCWNILSPHRLTNL